MRPVALLVALAFLAAAARPALADDDDTPPPSPNYVPASQQPPPTQPPPAPPAAPEPPATAPLPPAYYAPAPRPIGYVTQRRWSLFVTGAGIFGSTYLGSIINALNAGEALGTIPIAGPFLLLHDDTPTGTKVLLGLDGVAQAAGLTLMILGVSLTKKIPVFGNVTYSLVPTGTGLAMAGKW